MGGTADAGRVGKVTDKCLVDSSGEVLGEITEISTQQESPPGGLH
jgi:hypothetical protein